MPAERLNMDRKDYSFRERADLNVENTD